LPEPGPRPQRDLRAPTRSADLGERGRVAGPCRRELSAHEIDEQLRLQLRTSQDVDWQLGRLLATFKRLRLYRSAGFVRFDDYVRECVGMSPSKAASLMRLEGKLCDGRQLLGAAYRSGTISWVRALTLLSVVGDEHAAAWIERATQVTFRRLTEEVRWATDMRDRAVAWLAVAPPPLDAALEFSDAEAVRQMCARYDADKASQLLHSAAGRSVRLRIVGPESVIALAREAMAVYSEPGDAPWQAFERMLHAATRAWAPLEKHRDPVFSRDGWRCRVPACSSRRNLHDHHIVFRSQGGGNERSNRVSVCAGHHHHGIHAGIIRSRGDANGTIHWSLGLVPGSDAGPQAVLETCNDVYEV
jgi:hypothetical protein